MKKNILVKDIYQYLEKFAPPKLAEEWDNIGLQVGSFNEVVRGILISLDVTEAVLWEAVEHDANLLITHHPILLRPIRNFDETTPAKRMLRLALQMDLNILSLHTNLDSTSEGLNDCLANRLKIKKLKPLLPPPHPQKRPAGLGRIGEIRQTTLQQLVNHVGEKLSLQNLRFVGDLKHPIQKVAVMTGSGGGFFTEAKRAGADVLITGDVKYHHALDALAEEIALIDIGHYAGEIGMVALIARKLQAWARQNRSSLPIFETQVTADPFQFWQP